MENIDEVRTARLTLRRIGGCDTENRCVAVCEPGGDADARRNCARRGSPYSCGKPARALGPTRFWDLDRPRSRIEPVRRYWWVRRGITIDENPEVDVGFMLLREFWGQGLATEIARESARIGFEVLGRESLFSFTAPDNLASRRVMEKVGFWFDRDFVGKAGEPQVLYRLTEAVWRQGQVAAQD